MLTGFTPHLRAADASVGGAGADPDPASRWPARQAAARTRDARRSWAAARPRGRACRSTAAAAVTAPRSVETVTGAAVVDADRGGGGGRQPGHGRPGGAGQVGLAVLQPARVEQQSARWPAPPGRRPGWQVPGGPRRRARRRARRRPSRPARRARPGRPRRRAGRGRTSIASARTCEHPRRRAVALVPRSTASNGRGRPSQLRNVPAFSTTAATGSTTSARSVTATGPQLQADHEAEPRRSAPSAAVGSGRSCGSTPPTSSAPSSPAVHGREDRGGVAAGAARAAARRPRRRRPRRGPRVGDRAAAGQQRRAARRPRPRRAHRPGAGTQASRAPVLVGEPRRRRRARRARPASRSPTRITAPSPRSVGRRRP